MRDEPLLMLLNLSDRQLDPQAKEQIRKIIGLSDADAKRPLFRLRSMCAYFSWCSDFEIHVIDILLFDLNVTTAEADAWAQELETEWAAPAKN